MADWFERAVVESGRLPLLCFFAGVILGFAGIRFSVRMIRAKVRWWPGNVAPGGLHIQHVVFGVVLILVAGVAALAIPDDLTGWRAAMAGVFGVGSALVLDEFALILHLDDVYWSERGRTSVDAVFVAIAFTGLLLLGIRPAGVSDMIGADEDGGLAKWGGRRARCPVQPRLGGHHVAQGQDLDRPPRAVPADSRLRRRGQVGPAAVAVGALALSPRGTPGRGEARPVGSARGAHPSADDPRAHPHPGLHRRPP